MLVIASCTGIQGTAALTSALFATAGITGTVGLRQLVGAGALLLLARPELRGRTPRQWAQIVLYGVAMAAMNLAFYQAVARLPLGVAATLLFLGPFAVAAAMIKRRWEIVFPLAGLAGVLLLARTEGQITWSGLLFGAISAAALALYTVSAQRLGHAEPGLKPVALSVSVASLLLLPFSLTAAPQLARGDWVVALSGLLGVALPYALDFLAIRMASARIVATLFALAPVVGAVIGALFLGDPLSGPAIAGIALIVTTGAALTWTAQTRRN